MVKPIPPKNATPKICFMVLPFGRVAIFNLIANHATPKIPITFPRIRPAIIPMDTGSIRVLPIELKSIAIPAFASANRGITSKATGRCKSCSNLLAGVPMALILSLIFKSIAFCRSCIIWSEQMG